jgi:hypothetical protein
MAHLAGVEDLLAEYAFATAPGSSTRAFTAASAPVYMTDTVPDWDSLATNSATIWIPDLPKTKEDLWRKRNPVIATGRHNIKIAPHPFAKGGVRFAYYALIQVPGKGWQRYVAKEFIEERNRTKENYLDQVENSGVARFLAGQWGDGVSCLEARAFQITTTGKWYNLEKALEGKFVKWSNNTGAFIKPHPNNRKLYEFLKWTYEYTGGRMMFTDAQGCHNGDGWTLTDPAMLCRDITRFGPTNFDPVLIEVCYEGVKHVLECGKSIYAPGGIGGGTAYAPGFSMVGYSAFEGAKRSYLSRRAAAAAARAEESRRAAESSRYDFLPRGGEGAYAGHLPDPNEFGPGWM